MPAGRSECAATKHDDTLSHARCYNPSARQTHTHSLLLRTPDSESTHPTASRSTEPPRPAQDIFRVKVVSHDFERSVVSRDKPTWKILFPALTLQTRKPTAGLERPVQACILGCPVLALETQLLEGCGHRPPPTPPDEEGRAPRCSGLSTAGGRSPRETLDLRGSLGSETWTWSQPSRSLGKGGGRQHP